ncbi:MAG: DJ-1/PfpI family protein [Clostridia bacterium]|nr:DJ-1/PfpI family protein [Clostridia bacterium]
MVYVFLAEGFEEIEALSPVDILRRGGIDVKTVGVGSDVIIGAHGIKVVCDVSERDVELSDIEAIILPGGMPGTVNLQKSKTVTDAINFACNNGKIIGAICAAPSIIGNMGLLNGKNAVCFDGFEKYLIGAYVSDKPVVRDGQIITARGAGVASEFGFSLLSALKCKEVADKLRGDMKYITV